MIRILALLPLCIVLSCRTGQSNQPPPAAPFNWNAYEPSTLAQVLESRPSFTNDPVRPDFTLDDGGAYRVAVVYTGKNRSLPDRRQFFFEMWSRALPRYSDAARMFQNEMLVQEGEREFWLPVQQVLEPHLLEELTPGETVDLYVACIGAVDGEWIIIVNEFQKRPSGGAP